MDNELLPCPFCGGKARLQDVTGYEAGQCSFVKCHNCDMGDRKVNLTDKAIERWNHRASAHGRSHDEFIAELKNVGHHSIDEELWRIKEYLAKFSPSDRLALVPLDANELMKIIITQGVFINHAHGTYGYLVDEKVLTRKICEVFGSPAMPALAELNIEKVMDITMTYDLSSVEARSLAQSICAKFGTPAGVTVTEDEIVSILTEYLPRTGKARKQIIAKAVLGRIKKG